MRKIVIAISILSIFVIGLVAGLILIRQQQDIRKKASTPEGIASINLSPASGSFTVGESFDVNVTFNPGGVAISGVDVKLTYPYSEASPALSASLPVISSALISTGDWACPITTVTPTVTGVVEINISCTNTDPAGYASSTSTPLATITFTVDALPENNPTSLSFSAVDSIITLKSDGSDTLLTPSSTGVYAFAAAPTASPTASPTSSPTASPTNSPTSSPASSPTTSPTTNPTASGIATATPKPTATSATATLPPDVPVTGLSFPTLLGIFLSLTLISLSGYLALKK